MHTCTPTLCEIEGNRTEMSSPIATGLHTLRAEFQNLTNLIDMLLLLRHIPCVRERSANFILKTCRILLNRGGKRAALDTSPLGVSLRSHLAQGVPNSAVTAIQRQAHTDESFSGADSPCHQQLFSSQEMAFAIIAGFKTVALAVAEAEASLVPVAQRWARQRRRFWVDLHTLPKSHPFWKARKRI